MLSLRFSGLKLDQTHTNIKWCDLLYTTECTTRSWYLHYQINQKTVMSTPMVCDVSYFVTLKVCVERTKTSVSATIKTSQLIPCMAVVGTSQIWHVPNGIALVFWIHVLGEVLNSGQCLTQVDLVGVEQHTQQGMGSAGVGDDLRTASTLYRWQVSFP